VRVEDLEAPLLFLLKVLVRIEALDDRSSFEGDAMAAALGKVMATANVQSARPSP
jgi:hypothetical protein